MTKQATPLYILRLAITLLLITALVAAALAGINAITKDRIATIKEQKVQSAMAEVLPGAIGMTETTFTDASDIVKTVYVAASDSPVQGYVAQVTPSGFGGAITMMVGVQDGKVTGISIVSHTETAGLGSVAADKTSKGDQFRAQFVGASDTLAVDDTIDSITGATITSRAVTAGVNAALAVQFPE